MHLDAKILEKNSCMQSHSEIKCRELLKNKFALVRQERPSVFENPIREKRPATTVHQAVKRPLALCYCVVNRVKYSRS